MGKIYDEIQKEINNINQAEGKNDLKSLLAKDLAKSKINYLCSLVNKYYENTNPNLIHQNLSLVGNDKLHDAVIEAEGFIGDDSAVILLQYEELKTPDLSFLDNAYTSEYDHFVVLDTLVKETVKIHYKNLDPNENNPHGASKEILLAFQKEADKLINTDKPVSEIKETDAEYNFIKDFINNPAKSFVSGANKNLFNFASDKERIDFINNVDKTAKFNIPQKVKEEFNLDDLVKENVKRQGSFGAEDLALDVINLASKYQDEFLEVQEENPELVEELPTYGELLYKMKERVTKLVLKDNMELSVDYPSVFLKKFLDNPSQALYDYYDSKANNYKAGNLKDPIFDQKEEKGNIDVLIRKANAFKVNSAIAREKYEELSLGKEDKWKEHQQFKTKWFLNHFKANYNNLKITEALEKNKGGFFENFFGTTSKEFKAFSRALEDMVNEGPGNGDYDGLKKVTQDYLAHKLKHYDVFLNGYDDREIAKLDSTSRGRVELCLSVLQSIQEAENSVAGKLNPEEFVAPDLDAEEAHDEYWQQTKEQFMASQMKEFNDFHDNLKKDSEIEPNPKLNEGVLDIDPNDLKDEELDNSKK